MPTIEHSVERLLPCPCLALSNAPFAACPECGGDGESWQEITVSVDYSYSRASRGARDHRGVPLEPDEDASVELTSVTDERGVEVELTSREEEVIAEECECAVEDRRIAAIEARYDAMMDR